MKFKNEITVNVNMTRKELIDFLKKQNYQKTNQCVVDDIYYVKNEVNLNDDILDIFKNYILIRVKDNQKYFVYKMKEYAKNGHIKKQGEVEVEILDVNKGKAFLENIGYQELLKMHDEIIVYSKEDLEIAICYVDNKYLFIEVEENDKYNSITKLIKGLENTNINYDKSNYFVKKAKIIFNKKYYK